MSPTTKRTPAYLQQARDDAALASEYAGRLRAEVDHLETAVTAAERKREAAMRSWKNGSEPPPAVIEAGVALSALRERVTLARADLGAADEAHERADAALAAAELKHDLQVAADREWELLPRLVGALEEVYAVATEARKATAPVMARARHPQHHAYISSWKDRSRPFGLAGVARRVDALAAGYVAECLRDLGDVPDLCARVDPRKRSR